jgi:hypothetical protein
MDLIIDKFNNLNFEKNVNNKLIYENKIVDYKIENNIIENFKKITIKEHSYPKKKNKWINFIKSNKNKLKVIIDYNPETILLNIIYKTPIYNFEKVMYQNVLNILNEHKIILNIYNYKNIIDYIKHFCILNINVSENEIIEILIKNNLIIQKNNKFILNLDNLNINKRKLIEYENFENKILKK